MNSHRNVAIVAFVCLIAVVMATIVRLSDESAKNREAVSWPHGERPILDTSPSFFSNPLGTSGTKAPSSQASDPVTARAYIVGDAKTGKIYAERNSSAALPVASMSKLVTAMVAMDTIKDPSAMISITELEATSTPPDGSHIGAGESFTRDELLYVMLLDSSNIAAEALASSTDREHFLELMSSYAWEVGMPSSFFADPSGVSPHNAASARDLLALGRYLYKYRPDILAMTRTAHMSVATTTDHGGHEFVSIHPFVSDPRFIGGKTGRTPQAGDTMMTIMDLGGQPIVFVVLGSSYDRRAADTAYLINKAESLVAQR